MLTTLIAKNMVNIREITTKTYKAEAITRANIEEIFPQSNNNPANATMKPAAIPVIPINVSALDSILSRRFSSRFNKFVQ